MADIPSPIIPAETPLPLWLRATSNEQQSPFGPQTKAHLIKKGESDPRVFDLIRKLEAKDTERNGEGRREWDWARRVCLGGAGLFQELHQQYKNPEDEQDMLWLAAYISDYSYKKFFVEYANRLAACADPQIEKKFSREEHSRYAETMRAIVPIIADVQPQVAISFAPQIAYALIHVFHKKNALENTYIQLAQKYPDLVLEQDRIDRQKPQLQQPADQGKFYMFPNPSLIINAAKKAKAAAIAKHNGQEPVAADFSLQEGFHIPATYIGERTTPIPLMQPSDLGLDSKGRIIRT